MDFEAILALILPLLKTLSADAKTETPTTDPK